MAGQVGIWIAHGGKGRHHSAFLHGLMAPYGTRARQVMDVLLISGKIWPAIRGLS